MRGPVTCQACGAKVREDRVRCLRCGAALHPTAGRAGSPYDDPWADREATQRRGGPSPGAEASAKAAGPPWQAGPAAAPAATLSTRTVAIVAAVIALGGFAAVLVSGSRPEEAPAAPAPVPLAVPAAGAERSRERTAPSAAPAGGVTPAAFRAVEASRAGVAAYSRGDVAGSVERFSAAVDTDPENADALNNLGQVLVRTGRAREAIPYFDRAMALAGDTWEYRFNRARAHAELQEWGRAIADYREADRLFPNDYVTAFNLAKALHASGDPARAASEFERAIALAPDQADFHLSHGIALEAAGRPRDAAAAYRRYLELEQAAPEAETITARIAQLEGPAEPLTP